MDRRALSSLRCLLACARSLNVYMTVSLLLLRPPTAVQHHGALCVAWLHLAVPLRPYALYYEDGSAVPYAAPPAWLRLVHVVAGRAGAAAVAAAGGAS